MVLANVISGLYDMGDGYFPTVMSAGGVKLAQNTSDALDQDLFDSESADPNFSQQRLQLSWIATASGSAEWVPMTLNGNAYEIYVHAIGEYIIMLGYADVAP